MKTNKYFLVPVTATAVKYENTGFRDILKTVDPELSEKEEERIEFKYGGFFEKYTEEEVSIVLEEFNKKVRALYQMKKLPNKIVVVDNGETIYELGTEFPVTVENKTYLDVFSATGEQVVDFFVENDDYSEQVAKFFQEFKNKKAIQK